MAEHAPLDILAFGAHPDDVELSAGGTLLKAANQGKKTGIVDLTRGELGTRGSAELRAKEAADAALALGLTARENLGLKDGMPEDEERAILALVGAIRRHRPRTVLANALSDRHTDHGRAAELVHRACFLAGLARIATADPDGKGHEPHRPLHILHYIQDRFREPSIVVDITGVETQKYAAIACYSSQFYVPGASEGRVEIPTASDLATPISTPDFMAVVRGRDITMGRYIGVASGEGFESQTPLGLTDLGDLV
ncbi:bacillithiol biosynthesis deacetylase BshB1 [Flavobacteriales bacterium]|nr:bacillithiol biosynthesis deacetylase BshB1 [Flavobacteriales bacterium]